LPNVSGETAMKGKTKPTRKTNTEIKPLNSNKLTPSLRKRRRADSSPQ